MARPKTVFNCNACGAQSPKWVGQCPACQAWNTLEESMYQTSAGKVAISVNKITPLVDLVPDRIKRLSTGIAEMDRVLGGGLVRGSVVLIGGDPGIGKSTLMLQVMALIGEHEHVLYITGEESTDQVALRAQRLGLNGDGLNLLAENRLESIINAIETSTPRAVVIDSIQTLYTGMMQSAPGSVAQVRETAAQLVRIAKQTGLSLFLIGHVTKEGTLAGPRVLEHMVDTVLYIEGETSGNYRVIRTFKNRFGAANEIGVFAMSESGLQAVNNPSAIFLSRQGDSVAGSAVLACQEGTRPMLVEVQALLAESHLAQPRRVCVGLDANRLAMLLAMLHRHAGITTYDQDVFINVVGGLRVTETAADLALTAAVVSSLKDRPLGKEMVVFGEIGLAGEVRPVNRGQDRLKEAAKLGFKQALIPYANRPKEKIPGMTVHAVKRLDEALAIIMDP